MSLPAATIASPDLLFGTSKPAERPAPVFVGEQRAKAVSMLAASIAEHRAVAVMQLVNKDPSLVFETLPIPARAGPPVQTEFPLACLRHGLAAGYSFAVSRGFNVNELLQDETTTLLQAALAQTATRNCEADISLLLGMGADYRNMTSLDALYGVMAASFPPKSDKHAPGAVAMLLDAKVDFAYPSSYMCPYSVLVSSGGWGVPETAVTLTKTMARFVKSGLSLERKTGAPAQTPLQRALGSKNGEAVIALIRVGAKSGPEQLNGKDLFDLMRAHGLEEFKPAVQAALMDSHISQQARTNPAPSQQPTGQPADAQPPASLRRRRLGTI